MLFSWPLELRSPSGCSENSESEDMDGSKLSTGNLQMASWKPWEASRHFCVSAISFLIQVLGLREGEEGGVKPSSWPAQLAGRFELRVYDDEWIFLWLQPQRLHVRHWLTTLPRWASVCKKRGDQPCMLQCNTFGWCPGLRSFKVCAEFVGYHIDYTLSWNWSAIAKNYL